MAVFWQEQFLDSSGNPYSGVKVYHYEPGTTTDKDIYDDTDEATTLAQPLVGDAAGTVSGYFRGSYRLLIRTSADVTIYDYDNVSFGGLVGDGSVIDGSIAEGTLVETVSGAFPATYRVSVSPSWVTSWAITTKGASSFKILYGSAAPSGATRSYSVIAD